MYLTIVTLLLIIDHNPNILLLCLSNTMLSPNCNCIQYLKIVTVDLSIVTLYFAVATLFRVGVIYIFQMYFNSFKVTVFCNCDIISKCNFISFFLMLSDWYFNFETETGFHNEPPSWVFLVL